MAAGCQFDIDFRKLRTARMLLQDRQSLSTEMTPRTFLDRRNDLVELIKIIHIDAEFASGLSVLAGIDLRMGDIDIQRGDGGADIGEIPFLSLQMIRIWTG